MPNLADVAAQLNEAEFPEIDPNAYPEQRGGRREPLYPGTYEFTLPASFDFKVDDDGTRQYLVALFQDAYALIANPGGKQWQGRISNRPYQTIKWVDNKPEKVTVDDFGLLLKALGFKGKLTNNKSYGEALEPHAGQKFLANSDWSARCNPEKPIYKDGAKVDGTLGCGRRYATKAYKRSDGGLVVELPKEDGGLWADSFICTCGANLMVNDNLQRIRAKK